MIEARASYHHGELKDALINAAWGLITEVGIEGFSLREVTRRAGVAPNAAAHHFGTAKGLLTEVALRGYSMLGEYLGAALRVNDPLKDLVGVGKAYVQFALDFPGQFRLMFRNDLVNRQDARYLATSGTALKGFADVVRAYRAALPGVSGDDREGLFAVWSAFHGMAHLVLEDKANPLFGTATSQEFVTDRLDSLLHTVLGRRL
jgi:AcrR family transcriptional regulator